ncbi:MAG: hypothetical protein F7C81_01320 [Desulfurococcales archaeon]|nr:hypothetical protein [Desulfurococcales archaeon]
MKIMVDSNGRMLCPVCKIPMDYAMETEKNSNGERRITRYYLCPACGTRVIDEQLLITIEENTVKVLVLGNGKQTIIRRITSSTAKRKLRKPRRAIG